MQAIYSVVLDGQDITAALNPILLDLSISDRAGTSSDSASITLDDNGGQIVMPGKGALMTIKLGWKGGAIGVAFMGKVDGVKAKGGRSGRTLAITAKGMDTRSKAKEPQRRHFDDKTVKNALDAAGQFAGIAVTVDPAFASITRPYISLDDESFVAFGERLARELGATFKIVGNNAVLAKRNGGTNAVGQPLSTVTATWGVNLHDYDVEPFVGRKSHKRTRTRHYNRKAAEWQAEEAETGTDDTETTAPSIFSEPDEDRAKEQSFADAAEYDRRSGEGSVTIEGNLSAQPEGLCVLEGCRPGIDGTYRIDGVDHSLSRGGGWTTSLQLKQPKGDAGKDAR